MCGKNRKGGESLLQQAKRVIYAVENVAKASRLRSIINPEHFLHEFLQATASYCTGREHWSKGRPSDVGEPMLLFFLAIGQW